MRILGIDVGGSGIKGAIVDIRRGKLVSERYRVKTPVPATPKEMAKALARVVHHFKWKGPVGCGMPGPIKDGRVMIVANLDKSWAGVRADELYSKASGCSVTVVNDADAAGRAEMAFGAGKGRRGIVIITTLGTGIGSAVFVNGTLVPNTELGQMEVRGRIAEARASARIRKEKNLSWEKWSKRLTEFYAELDMLFWPDLIIIGGGVSRKGRRFIPLIKVRPKIVPARLHNEAGIIGAALSARSRVRAAKV